MHVKVRKAVIPAAGYGTRMLPATKAMPKEMLPLVDKPAIQFIAEEAAASGIKEILIIIGEHKYSIVDHFSPAPELADAIEDKHPDLAAQIRRLSSLAKISFVKQPEGIRGLGSAVLCAEEFAAGEPVAVLYGDDVIVSETPVTAQLIAAFERYGRGVVGVGRVPREDIVKYCTLKVAPLGGAEYAVGDMIEKPRPEQIMSDFAVLGRCVLPPEIFGILRETPPGVGGERQLTDAMSVLARRDGMIAVEYEGRRYDVGSKLSYAEAVVDVALSHPEIGAAFARWLRGKVS
ncbi:MAG: UTP--glucose-1-phosphate uridylyltransferase [Clostridia bacterium]|nr:UTP--glucose-1-phosphate uridylyltransferase [Clostridia bacterium]